MEAQLASLTVILYMAMMARKTLDAEITDFTDAIGLLVRRMRAMAATHGLSWSEGSVIGRLAREGPATTADLARAEGVKPQSMGATIAVLEEMGLVERKPHPTDGRQMHIALTAKGAAVRKSAQDAKLALLKQAITTLDARERETLFAAGAIVKRLVDK